MYDTARISSSRNFIPWLTHWNIHPRKKNTLEKHPPAVYEAGITGLSWVCVVCLA